MSETEQYDQKLVGVDVSAFTLKAVFLNQAGKILSSESLLLNRQENTLAQLISFINHLKEREGNFQRIGIAVPGLVSHATNRIVFSTHIPEQAEIDFINLVRDETGLEVLVENDANAAAYGEFLCGAGRGSRNMFYVTLGAGVGGALIFNGEIWRGIAGFAGEFGYMTLNSEGMKLEEVASTQNIIRRIRNRFHQDHTSSLVRIGEERITIADVVREANNGDGFAQMMLERTGTYVGTGVASVINLLNIEKIVVGGEVMEAESFILPAVVERARELSFVPSFETTQFLAGELKDLATAVGAALLTNKKN
jgi:glucokinase